MFDRFFFGKHLEDDEHVVLIVHKHWLIGTKELFVPSVSFILAWTLLATRHTPLAASVAGVWGIASLVWWMRNFFDYYLDAWIITDHGIIDLEWLGWFHRQSARVLYSDIQGVSTEVSGILATLLRYGTVSVEKISTGSTIALPYAPRPRAVESRILKCMESYLHDRNLKNAKHIQDLLSNFVAQSVQEKSMAKPGAKKAEQSSSDSASPSEDKPERQPPQRPTKKSFTSSRV